MRSRTPLHFILSVLVSAHYGFAFAPNVKKLVDISTCITRSVQDQADINVNSGRYGHARSASRIGHTTTRTAARKTSLLTLKESNSNVNVNVNHGISFSMPLLEDDVKIKGTGQDGDIDMITHVKLIDASLRKLTGRGVAERMGLEIEVEGGVLPSSPSDIYEQICANERHVLISHGIQDDPIFNFGNKAALTGFHRSWDNLTSIPSGKSVVWRSKDEELRIELLRRVTDDNYVEGASGIRVRDNGTFLQLVDAVVWNCYNEDGVKIGQAAHFDLEKCPIIDSVEE